MKNYIFDFGKVIIEYEPAYMTALRVSDPEDAALIVKEVFDRKYWAPMDEGLLQHEELKGLYREHLPERLYAIADEIFDNWIYNIPEIDGMKELVARIKTEYGVKILLLSNISHYFADHANEVEALKDFDGFVFSARIGIVKPSHEIFDYLCKKFEITPSETVFVDDNRSNIEGANSFGIHGYLFDGNVEKLKCYLDEILQK